MYQDPATFFASTFATDGLKTLIAEVFGRLVGAATGSPIIRLETSFGGGKTLSGNSTVAYCQAWKK